MKAVEMMKKAIKDSDLCGWKWKADAEGLHWEYMDITFYLSVEEDEGSERARFTDGLEKCVVFVLGKDEPEWFVDDYHDVVKTVDEAIYWAARKMISKANYLY